MDAAGQNALLDVVDRWVRAKVRKETLPAPPRGGAFDEAAALFVTLRAGGELRGCIGTLEPRRPAGETAVEMAAAALEDPRFADRRIGVADLERLSVELSLLGPLRPVAGPEEVEVGRHGVLVEVAGRSGLFLPQVAVECGWTAAETLGHCCRSKLGLPERAWRLPDARISVFEATVVSSADRGSDP